jgi:hypothetical protein
MIKNHIKNFIDFGLWREPWYGIIGWRHDDGSVTSRTFPDILKEATASTATKGAAILGVVADTLRDRDADYKGADEMYASVMHALFPDGVGAGSPEEHHRFHLFMLMIVKVTRYARNWDRGHADSLTDLAAYAAMLASLDERLSREGAGEV